MERKAKVERKTGETDIMVSLDIDGSGKGTISTGIGFFDHMLTLWAKHGLFDLTVKAVGDIVVDGHHTVEDTGIVLGQAIKEALGEKNGIRRYGTAFVPMDEALAMVVVDISGRPFLVFDADIPRVTMGEYEGELTEEFLRAIVTHAGLTVHVKLLAGKNAHHIAEAIYKAVGRALADAVTVDERIVGVMSTKGSL
ncbi:MAG: hisB [Firmicutes bacterium]|nr:hisB [Bacillota bacterium]